MVTSFRLTFWHFLLWHAGITLASKPVPGSDSPGEKVATRFRGQRSHVPFPRWLAEYVRHGRSRGSVVAPMILPPRAFVFMCNLKSQYLYLQLCRISYVPGFILKISWEADGSIQLEKILQSYIQLEKILHSTWKNLTFYLKNKTLHFNDKTDISTWKNLTRNFREADYLPQNRARINPV